MLTYTWKIGTNFLQKSFTIILTGYDKQDNQIITFLLDLNMEEFMKLEKYSATNPNCVDALCLTDSYSGDKLTIKELSDGKICLKMTRKYGYHIFEYICYLGIAGMRNLRKLLGYAVTNFIKDNKNLFNTKPIPQPIEDKPIPQPIEDKPIPRQIEDKPIPRQIEDKPIPQIIEDKPIPQPIKIKESVPQPMEVENRIIASDNYCYNISNVSKIVDGFTIGYTDFCGNKSFNFEFIIIGETNVTKLIADLVEFINSTGRQHIYNKNYYLYNDTKQRCEGVFINASTNDRLILPSKKILCDFLKGLLDRRF